MANMHALRKILVVLGGTVVVGVFTVFVVLVIKPDIRRQIYTYAVPAFNLYQTMSLRRYVRERDFETAAKRLNRHIDMSLKLSRNRSKMVLGLVEAFSLVVEQARFEADFKSLKFPLERLVTIEPELFLGRIWLARALWYENPDQAIQHLNTAISLVSADERSYRQGIETALKLGQRSLARSYCDAYHSAQFGGPKPRSYHHLFRGLGFRRMGLVSHSVDGKEVVVMNSGLELNQRRSYDFSLPDAQTMGFVDLHLGTLPGLHIKLHGVSVLSSTGSVKFLPSDIIVTTRAAYVMSNDERAVRIITTDANDELLRVRFPTDQHGVVQISVDMTFSRLMLSSGDVCEVISD